MRSLLVVCSFSSLLLAQVARPPMAVTPLWNGKDLTGWHGQRHESPYKLAAMSPEARAKLRAEDDATMQAHWRVENGELVNDGEGAYLTTDEAFGDAEFWLEYKTVALADSGIYLRGCPQVQIWDSTEAGGKWKIGADKGSGGLWNNEQHERFPPVLADQPFGQWNSLRIRQIGERTWVTLNGKVTVDGVRMENYWDRKLPLPSSGPLQLQTHGGEIRFRNLRVQRFDSCAARAVLSSHENQGFESLFDGKSLAGWQGDLDSYEVVGNAIGCKAGKGGNLFTTGVYGDFIARLEFQLPAGGNNGLAIRYPGQGDPAYAGLEVQVLDDSAAKYATLKEWQFNGSVYGLVASHRGYLRPVGEPNYEVVTVRGSHITVELNGTRIVDADLAGLTSHLGDKHVGKDRKDGHFGFCGHGDAVQFGMIQIKKL